MNETVKDRKEKLYSSATQISTNQYYRCAVSPSPENLLETQILGPYARPLNGYGEGRVADGNLCFHKGSRWSSAAQG